MFDKIIKGVGALTGLIGAPIQHHFEKKRDERQFAHQKEMSEYAYGKDLEQWERSNVYNAPTQQMARLRDAGLNPRLVYGSGSQGAAGMAAQSPKYQAPRPEYRYSSPIDPTAILGQYQNFRKHNAEIDLLKQHSRKAKAEADAAQDYYAGRARLSSIRGWQSKKLYNWQNEMSGARSNLFKQQDIKMAKDAAMIDNMDSRTRLTDKQVEYYLWSTFGNLAIGATKALIPAGRAIGRGVKGIPKLSKWKGWKKAGPWLRGAGMYSGKDWVMDRYQNY